MLVQTLFVDTSPAIRWTSAEEDIEIGGETYRGSRVVSVADVELTDGLPDGRAGFSVAVPEDADYDALSEDSGPVEVIVGWAKSTDNGQTWTALSRKVVGRMSTATIEGRVVNVEIETLRGDVDRGGVATWSHEDQQAEFAGDLGFEYARALAEGDVEIGWPN